MFYHCLLHSLPSIVFEPLFIGGIVGCFPIYFAVNRKKESFVYFKTVLLLIGLMITWRLIGHSAMVSKRYFEVLIIPFICLYAYGFSISVKLFFEKNQSTNKTFLHISNTVFVVVLSIVSFVYVIWGTINVFKVDSYKKSIIRLYKLCSSHKEPSNKITVYTNINDEVKRIAYYAGNGEKIEVNEFSLSDNLFISEIVPDFLYINEGIYFFVENRPGIRLSQKKMNIDEKWGKWELLGAEFTSKKKKSEIVLYRFIPSVKIDRSNPRYTIGSNVYVINNDEINSQGTSTEDSH